MRPLPTGLRYLTTALLLSAVLTLVAWRTGGDFFKVDGRYYGWNLGVTRVLLFVALTGLFYVLPRVLKRSQRIPRVVFASWVVYLGSWLVAVWPGIVMTDTQSLMATSQLGVVREWFSWMQSVFMIASLDLIPHVWLITVIQVLATAATMAYATQVLMVWRPNAGAAIAMNVVAALSVPVVVNAVLLSRDIFFALLHVVLALAVAETVTRRKHSTPGRIAAIAALTGFLSLYRGDGIVLLVVVPVLLMALRPSWQATLQGAAAFAAAALAFHVLLPAVLHVEDESRPYQLSLRVNPLGAVLRTDFYSLTKDRDLQQLSRVIDVSAVRDMYDPAEIPAFWANKWNAAASEADFEAFISTADRLLRENAATVLAGRVATFGSATGINRGQFTTPQLAYERRFEFVGPLLPGVRTSAPSRALYDAATGLIRRSAGYTGALSTRSALFWNFLPWLGLLVGCLLLWRRIPFIAVISVILLSRVPLVFLAAPAAQFKYYLSVMLGGVVVLGLLLALVPRQAIHRPALLHMRRRVRGRVTA